MTTASDLVEETRRYLLSNARDEIQTLNEALDASETGVDIAGQLGGIQTGSYISIDLEVMYVQSVSSLTATVARGVLGSTPTTHTSGTDVYVNSPFTTFAIFQALNNEVAALPGAGLWQMKSLELTYNAAFDGYNLTGLLPADVLDIYELRFKALGSQKRWPEIRSWQFLRNAETDVFSSSLAIILNEPADPGQQLRVLYKAPFAAFTDLTTDVNADAGLDPSMNDIPPLGAAWRLTQVREVKRNLDVAQGDTRRAIEVPPGAQLTSARGLRDLWARRVREESANLTRRYPPRRNR